MNSSSSILCQSNDPDFKLQAARDIRQLTKTSLRCRRQLSQAVGPSVSTLRFDSSESHEPALLALLNLAVKDEKERLWTIHRFRSRSAHPQEKREQEVSSKKEGKKKAKKLKVKPTSKY
ncbi:hypothetical protein K1719_039364 [Acacia pycnantha]|nr:hypothetical protein K1719_039364 [Acacia pycnantha]